MCCIAQWEYNQQNPGCGKLYKTNSLISSLNAKKRQTDRQRNEKKLQKPVNQLQFEDLTWILIQTKNCPPTAIYDI